MWHKFAICLCIKLSIGWGSQPEKMVTFLNSNKWKRLRVGVDVCVWGCGGVVVVCVCVCLSVCVFVCWLLWWGCVCVHLCVSVSCVRVVYVYVRACVFVCVC